MENRVGSGHLHPQQQQAAPRVWQSKTEWEVLVENIAQSHARLASGIQLAIEKQWGNNFAASLQAYATTKEDEIRSVCSSHYQEFVDSIEEVVQMKTDVTNLQKDIERFQSELTTASTTVLSAYDSLAACHRVQTDIDDSIEKLQQCQRIVGLATKIDVYIEQGKLYHALKGLEELRSEIAGFRGKLFPQRMNEWMHSAVESIKEEAKRRVSSWLEEIRASSLPIGEYAIKRFENQVDEQYYEQDILEKSGRPASSSSASFSSQSAGRPASGSTGAATSFGGGTGSQKGGTMLMNRVSNADDVMQLPSLKVLNSDAEVLREKNNIHAGYMKSTLEKLGPMLRILHVYRAMNQVSELTNFYNANRLPQLQLPSFLKGDVAMITPEKFVGQHEELFKKFTGAFCLEQLLCRYSNEALLSKKELNGIFRLIMQSLCGIITASILRIESPKTILQIKLSAVTCARALGDEVHEYNTAAIFDTFRRLGAQFRHSMLSETKKQLKGFMSSESFQQLKVSRKEFGEIVALCGLESQQEQLLRYSTEPKTSDMVGLPFTQVVSNSCKSVISLIETMYEFERYLNINDWGESVCDDTIEALGFLNDILNELIDANSDLQVSMVVVMGVNACYLAFACDRFEEIVKQQTELWEARAYGYSVNSMSKSHTVAKPSSSRTMSSRTGAKKKFESTTTRAQDMVCELMLKKIDDLLSSFYYINSTPTEVSLQADPAMWDLINYLKITFAQLAPLSTVVKEAIHFAVCIHIAKALEQVLCGNTIKKFTMAGVSNFKRNLDALTDFIGTLQVTHLKESFHSLTQLLEVLISGEAEKLLDSQHREPGKYPHLSNENLTAVLEKLKDSRTSKLWKSSKPTTPSTSATPVASTTTPKASKKSKLFRRS